jgi:hypothetical protein
MPHFSAKGNDTYICQKCAKIMDCVDHPPQWRPDITGSQHAGNVCPPCIRDHEQPRAGPASRRVRRDPEEHRRPMGLYDYCHIESGGLTGRALDDYVNRYYGHG